MVHEGFKMGTIQDTKIADEPHDYGRYGSKTRVNRRLMRVDEARFTDEGGSKLTYQYEAGENPSQQVVRR